MKRMIIRIALVLALSLVVTPIAISQQDQTVSQAKNYKTTRKKLRKLLKKLDEGFSTKKIKKTIGRSIGKPYKTIKMQDGSGVIKKYVIRYYLTDKHTVKLYDGENWVVKQRKVCADVYFTFYGKGLEYWECKEKSYYPEEEEPAISYDE